MELQNPVLDRLAINPSDLMADIAVGLYMDRRITVGEGAEIAGLTQSEFRRLLGRLNVAAQYDLDDFRHDLAVLRERGVQ